MVTILPILSSPCIYKISFLFPPDEKEKYDPTGFRDLVIAGLDKAGHDPEAIFKFLDAFGSKQDYRRYGEALFDILIAGGLLGKHSHHSSYIYNPLMLHWELFSVTFVICEKEITTELSAAYLYKLFIPLLLSVFSCCNYQLSVVLIL